MSNDLKPLILAYMARPKYQPMTKSDFARELKVTSETRRELRRALDDLTQEGAILIQSKGRYVLRQASRDRLVGVLRIGAGGRGSFVPDPLDAANLASGLDLQKLGRLSLTGRELGNALNGDRVEVRIEVEAGRRGARGGAGFVRANVTRIIERGKGRIVGIYREQGAWRVVEPLEPDAAPVAGIMEMPKMEVLDGQLVSVEILEWSHARELPKGRVVQVLGWPGDPGVDIEAVIQKHHLPVDFPDEVLAEARGFRDEISEEERARREDWTKLPVITIDPKTAKDHDDAIYVEEMEGGGWRLAVHIADVSHFVKPGSSLDIEAKARGNSTYLVDRVLPMLPQDLSNDLCSLRPGVERLTKCAVMEFDAEAKLRKARFVDAVILSPKKFAYEEAQAILDQAPQDEMGRLIHRSWELASRLRARRFAAGSLDLDFPEYRVELDDHGRAVGVQEEKHDNSHRLIEEFMLVANEAVAKAIRERGIHSVYRVHEDPDYGKLEEFAEQARIYGYRPGDLSNKKHVQKLIEAMRGSIEEPSLKLSLLKSLKRASYAGDPLGHYGLGKEDYTHFTSPIRRYADLVVHRSLQRLLSNAPKVLDRLPSYADLGEIAVHISETERTSAAAETETKKLKIYEFLEDQASDGAFVELDATVSEVRPMGVFIELTQLSLRALIRREDLPGHKAWHFDGGLSCYMNTAGVRIVGGQRMKVRVVRVNRLKEMIDCEVVQLGDKPKRANTPVQQANKVAKKKPKKRNRTTRRRK